MKFMRYANNPRIPKVCIDILQAVLVNDLISLSEELLRRRNQRFKSSED